jgi:succinate dehydrogenase / fumarate reductase membrane anchor subunit
MRLSGVLLLFLVLGHLFVIRVLDGLNQVDLGFVTLRWAGLGWRSYDLAMLVLAMVHGTNGLRGLAYEHVPRRVRSWLLPPAYAVCLAATALGTYVIAVFSRPL